MSKINNKPTRGTPLTEAEMNFRPTKNWVGGARFEFTSTHGSHSSNSGSREGRKRTVKSTVTVYDRPVIRPRWARRYV